MTVDRHGRTPDMRLTPAARCARGLMKSYALEEGARECRVPSAPAASCALGVVQMHTSIHSGRTGNHPASPHAMVLTASFVLSPAIGLSCHRRSQEACFPGT